MYHIQIYNAKIMELEEFEKFMDLLQTRCKLRAVDIDGDYMKAYTFENGKNRTTTFEYEFGRKVINVFTPESQNWITCTTLRVFEDVDVYNNFVEIILAVGDIDVTITNLWKTKKEDA